MADDRRPFPRAALRDSRAYAMVTACVMVGAGSLMALMEHPGWGLPYTLLLLSVATGVAGAGLGRFRVRPARRVSGDGSRVTVRFRRLPAIGLALGGVATASLLGPSVRLLVGDTMIWLMSGCLVVLTIVTGVYVVIAFRDCRLVLDPDGIALTTWFEEGWVAWEDLRAVSVEHSGMWVVRLRVDPAAAGLRRRRVRLAIPERRARRSAFELHVPALDDPVRLLEVVERLRALDRDRRQAALSHGVAQYLRHDLHGDYLFDQWTRATGVGGSARSRRDVV